MDTAPPPDILAWIQSPLGLVVSGACALVLLLAIVLRRRKQAKLRDQAAEWVGVTAMQVRTLIEQDIREGHWQTMVENYSGAVHGRVLAHLSRIDARLNDVIDEDFFTIALKGSLSNLPAIGQDQWRVEFEEMANHRFAELLELDVLQQDVYGLMHDAGNQLSTRWTPRTGGPPPELSTVSPERLRKLIGLPRDMGNSFIRESIFDATALGATILGALSLGTGTHILGGVLAVLDNHWFQGFVYELILDYVIEEVGEEVIEEVAEAVVALFTGIGAVYTLYKFGKYAWKFKKLFIDKEPLHKVRAQIRGVVRERFHELADQLSDQTATAMTIQRDKLIQETADLEYHCRRVIPERADA